jgi:hypothetical protein
VRSQKAVLFAQHVTLILAADTSYVTRSCELQFIIRSININIVAPKLIAVKYTKGEGVDREAFML